MNSKNKKNRAVILIILDIIVIVISFLLAFFLRFDFDFPVQFFSSLSFILPIFIIFQIGYFILSGKYDIIWRFTSLWDMISLVQAIMISNLMGIVFLWFFNGATGYPRSVILIFFFLNILFACLSRVSVRVYHSHFYGRVKFTTNLKKGLILIGAGVTGEKIAREIKSTPNAAYTVLGMIDDDITIQGSTIHGIPIIGTVNDLNNTSIDFDEILITAPSATGDQIRRIVKACKKTGKSYKTVPSLSELIDTDISLATIRNVSYVDLLGREEVKLDMNSIDQTMYGKRVLITGAGGSIGSELVRQCLIFKPAEIICIDISEENIFNLEEELKIKNNDTIIKYILCTINSLTELEKPFLENQPQIVFHAAAYKHVPIQENHPWAAVKTNIGGTLNMVKLSDKYNVELFVLVSTDKAVNPVNVMGATKRTAEKIILSFNQQSTTKFMAVRFGNVLGSSGSAIPIFQKQINSGGPLTITHPEMTRYFMSIQEASQLILQCVSLGKEGQIFLLEMGKPIKILQMAKDLIRLSGLEPDIDIPIVFTGLRSGEKLYEELQLKEEKKINTEHEKIMILKSANYLDPWKAILLNLNQILLAAESLDSDKIQKLLKEITPTYQPRLLRPVSDDMSSKFDDTKAIA